MIEIRLSGSGGQGLITAGIILAEAAVLEGKEVIQSQSYGPEARGGASKAEVIISDAPIHHPKVLTPSIAWAMTQEACDKYTKDLADDALLIIDDSLVTRPPQNQARIIKIPITQLAKQQLGNSLFANIVALGVLVGASQVVSAEAITEAVVNRFPPHTRDKNIQALKLGFNSVG
jgi:2-oxoglutarate ferredoxin oxidoreductase subunit gamma